MSMDFLTPTAIDPNNQLSALWQHTTHTPLLAYNTWHSKKHKGTAHTESSLIILLHMSGAKYKLLSIPDSILQSTAHSLADGTITLPEACTLFMEYVVCSGGLKQLTRYVTSVASPCNQPPCMAVWQQVFRTPTLEFLKYLVAVTTPSVPALA